MNKLELMKERVNKIANLKLKYNLDSGQTVSLQMISLFEINSSIYNSLKRKYIKDSRKKIKLIKSNKEVKNE